jgi:hypothetical protein
MPTKRRASQWQNTWWPLAVAVAWVLLRSRQAVEQLLDRHPHKPVTFRTVDICAATLKAGGQHTTLELENSEAAFRELRYHLETDEIEVLGTWFVREGNLEGSARTKMGEQEPIPYTKISSLRYFDDHEDPCLIPRDRHAAHGSSPRTNLCGYRDVQVRSAALVRAFPDEESEEASAVSAIVGKAGLPPAERKLIAPADWYRNAIKTHPKQPNERFSDYAARLVGLMEAAPVTRQWKYTTMYRRLYDKVGKTRP